MLSGWVDTDAFKSELSPALCGCDILHRASDPSLHPGEALTLRENGEAQRAEWRCPREGEEMPADREGLSESRTAALDRIEHLTGARCNTCPKAYTKHDNVPWLSRALRAYNLRDSPRLVLIEPRPTAALLEAVEHIERSVNAYTAWLVKHPPKPKNHGNQ